MGIPDRLTCLLRNPQAGQEATVRSGQGTMVPKEPRTGSKLGKEYIKAVFCHPAYLNYMQSTSCEMLGWMKHKLQSRLLGEIYNTALMYSFSYLEPVCCSMSSSNYCFLTCIQVSPEAGQVVWYSHLLKNFPQFTVIHTVKGFGIVNKAEADVFLELSCFFDDPADVGNLISGSSAFSKSSLNIWTLSVHVLLCLACFTEHSVFQVHRV